MKILAFSDVHCDRAACEAIVAAADAADAADAVDLIIGAGDFAQQRQGLAETMGWLRILSSGAIYVAGNNETVDELREATDAVVLHGSSVQRAGVTVAGIGCSVPPIPHMPWGSVDLEEDEARKLLGAIADCDILISHSPPKGVADMHASLGSIGSVAVRQAAERLQPKLLFCGHVHDCWGQEGMIGATRVVNLDPRPNWFEVVT